MSVIIRNRQLSVCQGYFTCIYIGFWQGPFPKSGLDKILVFPMMGFGSFYCIASLAITKLNFRTFFFQV